MKPLLGICRIHVVKETSNLSLILLLACDVSTRLRTVKTPKFEDALRYKDAEFGWGGT